MTNKLWYCSRVLWINIIAIITIIIQGVFGYVISPEIQVAVLAIVNVIMRAVTNQGLSGKK